MRGRRNAARGGPKSRWYDAGRPHPPAGLRHRMLTARTPQEPTVTLDDGRMERLDAELGRHFDRTARTVAWSG
ncbi:hypothetical protein ACFUYE_30220 [Micromonospora humida]|uniref:hypothetical protein n=1 Tax=Micromonospora humida TaxID=2809018 RepID=UPI003672DFE3